MESRREVLVTGANKGIGLAISIVLLESYSDTYVYLSSRDASRGAEAKNAILNKHPEFAHRISNIVLDVANDNSVKSAAKKIGESLSARRACLYGIVNNAGIAYSDDGVTGVIEVNTHGPKRVIDEFAPLLEREGGRVVNVSSASGPNYLSRCDEQIRDVLTDQNVSWDNINSLIEAFSSNYQFASGKDRERIMGDVYGFTKACTNALTMFLAKQHPHLKINACTPGYIETDMTAPFAMQRGIAPSELGMKKPRDGALSSVFLLMHENPGSGFYFGSDCMRSPLDRYRSPGDPPYTGEQKECQ